jgi:HEAT repeat protein
MQNRFIGGIFKHMTRRLKQLTSMTSEKPAVTVEEYVLEHFLLYHGLVGSTPENQRQFKDTSSDIEQAVSQQNSHSLAIALRLPPLWWEEKLQTVFAQLAENDNTAVIATLLPDTDSLDAQSDPLQHEDWKVRANAANMLAFLNCTESLPRLEKALAESADSIAAPAFPHLSNAIGKLQLPAAQEILQKYLFSPEPWFRVDAARALCLWPQNEGAHTVLPAMLANHTLSDYMAVVIARQYDIAELLLSSNQDVADGALEVIIGVVAASKQTFSPEIVIETKIDHCWPTMQKLWSEQPSPRFLRANLTLADWFKSGAGVLSDVKPSQETVAIAQSDSVSQWLLHCLNKVDISSDDADSFARNTISLIGDLKIKSAVQKLQELAKDSFVRLDDTIEAMGKLGDPSFAPTLIELAQHTVNIPERTQQSLSHQPVSESQPDHARRYWLILKALGELPDSESIDFLITCSGDFAADKRQQAFGSLLSAISLKQPSSQQLKQIESLVERRLEDPYPAVRALALSAIAQLKLVALVPAASRLLNYRDSSLSRQAYKTLEQLYMQGFNKQVLDQLQKCWQKEFDSVRRQQLIDFANSLKAKPSDISDAVSSGRSSQS